MPCDTGRHRWPTALLYAQEKELKRFRRGIPVLDTVITLAPLLGLLGTVTGMMRSFSLIGGELSAPGAITGGIAEALIATAFGLGIAITSLIPFNILNTRMEEARQEMESAATELELLVPPAAQPRTPGVQAAPARPGNQPDRAVSYPGADEPCERIVMIRRSACFGLILGIAACAWAQSPAPAPPSSQASGLSPSELAAIWNDPVFQKQFIGSYGINSEIEPRVTPEEVTILEKIRPLMAKDLPKAEATLKRQIKPDCSAVLDFTLGGIYFQQDKMAEALENYRKAVTKFPSFRRAWRNLGLIYVRDGKYDDAISAFTKMIELGGGDAYSFGLLGFAYAAKQDYQAAEVAYRNALLLQPDNTQWRLGLTRCVFKQKKYEDAVTLLEVLIGRNPDQAEFWLLQAQAYLGMKQPLKAAEDLEAVDRLGKATVDSLYTLGDIYVNESLMDLAVRAYGRAMDADPNQPVARPLRSAETLAARGALAQARQIATHLQEVRGKQMAEPDLRKLLKLEARLSMAEGGSSAGDGGGAGRHREARSARRRSIDVARAALLPAERTRPGHLLLRTRGKPRSLRGQCQNPSRPGAGGPAPVHRSRAVAAPRAGTQTARRCPEVPGAGGTNRQVALIHSRPEGYAALCRMSSHAFWSYFARMAAARFSSAAASFPRPVFW